MAIGIVGTPVFNRYTQNWSVTVPAGANLAIGSAFIPDAGAFTATLNGDAMALVRQQPNNTTDWRNALFRRNSPASGNFVRLRAGGWYGEAFSTFLGIEDADISGDPIRDTGAAEASGTAVSVTVPSVAGDLVVAVVWSFDGGTATGGDLTAQNLDDGRRLYLLSRIATGTTTTLTTTLGSSGYWIGVGASVIPASAGNDTLTIDSQPTTATSGVAMGNVVISSSDAASTETVTATIASGGGSLSGTTSAAMTAGEVTFSNLIITGSGAHTLRFSATGHDPVDTATITVSAPSSGLFRPYFVTG